MSVRAPNSHLQNRILLYLSQYEVTTVSGLAEELMAARPSVSRAINVLREKDLVAKTEKNWTLTSSA